LETDAYRPPLIAGDPVNPMNFSITLHGIARAMEVFPSLPP
jgi:hypothetical protein